MKRFSWFLLLLLPILSQAQHSYQYIANDSTSYLFGQIYAGFYTGLNNNYEPQSAFEFKQGIIGYSHSFKGKVTGKIMFDVTRTTHFTLLTDTSGNNVPLDYFEGSKYTAYLKMAEIKWILNSHFTLRFGQLLNTQYLTFQDRFWGFRYIDVTFQEKYRFGMPADFGIQADYKVGDKLLLQLSVVNGEGPFRYQDKLSNFLYSVNVQYSPLKNFTLKLYLGIETAPDTGIYVNEKKVISFFAGYKTKNYGIGVEANYVKDYSYLEGIDKYGLSVYGFIAVTEHFAVLGRYDYLCQQFININLVNNYYILGIQYSPLKYFTTSLNFRYYSKNDLPIVYFNVGLKF